MENQMSLIEIALEIMESSNSPLNIYTLIEETLAKKGVTDEDGTLAAKLYTDITISSKFVYMGEDQWDLKSRQSLEQFDKDGSSFISKDEEYDDPNDVIDEDEDDLDLDEDEDEDDEDRDNYDEDEDESDDNYEDGSEDEDSYDDDNDDNYDDSEESEDEDSYDDDEDKYNQIMDDYEDLYED